LFPGVFGGVEKTGKTAPTPVGGFRRGEKDKGGPLEEERANGNCVRWERTVGGNAEVDEPLGKCCGGKVLNQGCGPLSEKGELSVGPLAGGAFGGHWEEGAEGSAGDEPDREAIDVMGGAIQPGPKVWGGGPSRGWHIVGVQDLEKTRGGDGAFSEDAITNHVAVGGTKPE
jgi:hypothetical protein